MKKVIFVCLSLVLAFSMVSSERSVVNSIGILVPSDVVAGEMFTAQFGFDYLYGGENVEGSPLIIKLNVTSLDEDYPVWRGDFKISGSLEKKWSWTTLGSSLVRFDCSDNESLLIEHSLDAQTVYPENGTFYCYSEEGDLHLNEHDNVYLEVVPDRAIYPGEYNFSVELFYLTDERRPFVNITNKNDFDKYYREVDNVLVRAEIEDVGGIGQKWSKVLINGVEIFDLSYDYFDDGEYYFSKNTPVDIIEEDYELFVFAEDSSGNMGNDSVALKIDRSAPVISLVDFDDIVGEILNISVNVVDGKSGVDDGSVMYRLREMDGSSVCPEDGVGTWDCYDSGWLGLDNVSGDLFGVEVNTSEIGLNGDYWLQVRASDVLGNMGVLE